MTVDRVPHVGALRRLTLIVIAAGMASSCGYSLAGRGSFLPTNIRVVAVPLLQNSTPFSQIEQKFTDKIRLEFIQRGSQF